MSRSPQAQTPLLIVNPAAGGGRAGRTFPEVRRIVEAALGPVEATFTEGPGHATELSRAAAQRGHDLVVALGGDGTLHEVVNGVLTSSSPQTTVGLIAQGTGGDFRRTLGIDHRLDQYVARLRTRRCQPIDVGHATFHDHAGRPTERYFVNVLSAGMGGLVDRYVAKRSGAALGGGVAYLGAAARALIECPRAKLRCRTRRGTELVEHQLQSYLLAVCNGRYFGGGMPCAPSADLRDGIFELVSLDAPSKLGLAWAARSLYQSGLVGMDRSFHQRIDAVDVDCDDEHRASFLLDVDGEALGQLPLRLEVRPGVLNFCY